MHYSFKQFLELCELYDTGADVEVSDRSHSRFSHPAVVLRHHAKPDHRVVKWTDGHEGHIHVDSLKPRSTYPKKNA